MASFRFLVEDQSHGTRIVESVFRKHEEICVRNLKKFVGAEDDSLLLVWSDSLKDYHVVESEEDLALVKYNSKLKISVREERSNGKNINGVIVDHGPFYSWSITNEEKELFKKMFRQADTDEDGFVTLDEISRIFSDSGLEVSILTKIWNLVDIYRDERLDEKGYVIMRVLIKNISSHNATLPIPDKLPNAFLIQAKKDLSPTIVTQTHARRGAFYGGKQPCIDDNLELFENRGRIRRNAFCAEVVQPQISLAEFIEKNEQEEYDVGEIASNFTIASSSTTTTTTTANNNSSNNNNNSNISDDDNDSESNDDSFSSVLVNVNRISKMNSNDQNNSLPPQSSLAYYPPNKKPKLNNQGKFRCESDRFYIGYADTLGKRVSMEDELIIFGHFRGEALEDFVGIYDGHGGNDAALFASQTLHEVLAELLPANATYSSETNTTTALYLKEAFLKTNERMKEANIRGGTTALVALVLGEHLYIANAGDCRAVLFREGKIIRCSTDHKPSLPEEEKRIVSLGGHITTTIDRTGNITSRVCGVLAVSRALGDFSLNPFVSAEPDVVGPINILDCANASPDNSMANTTNNPIENDQTSIHNDQPPSSLPLYQYEQSDTLAQNDQKTAQANKKDCFLIMACDGLWDKVSDEEAVALAAPIVDCGKAAARLRDYAFYQGSKDNITVVVIRFTDRN